VLKRAGILSRTVVPSMIHVRRLRVIGVALRSVPGCTIEQEDTRGTPRGGMSWSQFCHLSLPSATTYSTGTRPHNSYPKTSLSLSRERERLAPVQRTQMSVATLRYSYARAPPTRGESEPSSIDDSLETKTGD